MIKRYIRVFEGDKLFFSGYSEKMTECKEERVLRGLDGVWVTGIYKSALPLMSSQQYFRCHRKPTFLLRKQVVEITENDHFLDIIKYGVQS